MKILEGRKQEYDQTAKPCANDLKEILPDIPRHEASTKEELAPFLRYLKTHGGAMLKLSNQAADLIAAVKKDVEAFGMPASKAKSLCTLYEERFTLSVLLFLNCLA